mgnify:CR=1 FL=1
MIFGLIMMVYDLIMSIFDRFEDFESLVHLIE